MRNLSRIEPLESRIAPAVIIMGTHTAKYDDVDGDHVTVTVSAGNSGDIGKSFRVHGSHPQAAHEFDWVSDPNPGDANFITD